MAILHAFVVTGLIGVRRNFSRGWAKIAVLDKVRHIAPGAGVCGDAFFDELRWEVVLSDGDRNAGNFVEIVTYTTEAEIANWRNDPDAEIRGTGLTWHHAATARKLHRAGCGDWQSS